MLTALERNKFLRIIQGYNENKLTKTVIIPLLENMGFQKVEFYGGVNEEGKDILCWETDKFEQLNLTVVQVKHFKLINKSSSSQSLQTIINQLTTCFKKPLLYTDQTSHYPIEAMLITTFPVDSKTLQTRFSQFPDISEKRIRVIDGLKLTDLLIKHYPIAIKNLLGLRADITNKLGQTLDNGILLKALGYSEKKDLRRIYTDIDFSLGKLTTKLFFKGIFNPITKSVLLNEPEWIEFKRSNAIISKEFYANYVDKPFNEIEENYKLSLEAHKQWEIRLRDHQKQKPNFPVRRDDSDEKIEKEYNSRLGEIRNSEPQLGYKFDINGVMIAQEIEVKRRWIEDNIHKFNNKTDIDINALRGFLEKCVSIIESATLFFSNEKICTSLLYNDEIILRRDLESTRFKLSIHDIFATGINTIVLGEAGAGKSTSLQAYALYNSEKTEKIILYLPLARIAQNWDKYESNLPDDKKVKLFDEGIAKYLISKGIAISPEQFKSEISTKGTVFLLDGLDEAIKMNPWLPKAIAHLSDKYKSNIQVIVSSRMSGSYYNEIPFLTVTLLPFTDTQRDAFIIKWFEPDEIHFVDKIRLHLKTNKAISEVAKNPLLNTILCVLAKNEIDLPTTEIRLYNDRIKLLTGYYDRAKNIDSRISSMPQTLETIAQKLAFQLHNESKREEDNLTLEKLVIHLTVGLYSAKEAKTALEELIDPCNILVPMTDDGKFGFGHLAYQEHLAAKEISSDRSINIISLLKHTWWRNPLIFYAKMTKDLTWLINDIGNMSRARLHSNIITEMINARPKMERGNLLGLLNSYIILEKMDD